MKKIPNDGHLDSTLALGKNPYRFIKKQAEQLGSEVFATRVLLRKTICMTGHEAARLFSDTRRFIRKGATPSRLQKTLFGHGGVQTLDDAQHRHRKEMFLSLMTPGRIADLSKLTAEQLQRRAVRWAQADAQAEQVILYRELQQILTRAVCAWAGVPLSDKEIGKRTRQLTVSFDHAGSIGPQYWHSRQARFATEHWIAVLIKRVRASELPVLRESAISRIAFHHELNGELLEPRIAAVELLNVLRPTVAVSVYIVFIVHTLHRYPELRERLQRGDPAYTQAFVHEVRRFYPFFPATPARVRKDFVWKGYRFPAKTRVMLDLHGVNHDANIWRDPEQFRPERFGEWDRSAFNFIPQGSGDHHINHRCPGEWITIELMKQAVDFFVNRISYQVPEQDLSIDETRLPALPRSRLVIANVRVLENK